MVKLSQIVFSIVIVFIATFMLFYIFDNLHKVSQDCKTESPPSFCRLLSSFTIAMLVILLIIGGFILTISATAYILISG